MTKFRSKFHFVNYFKKVVNNRNIYTEPLIGYCRSNLFEIYELQNKFGEYLKYIGTGDVVSRTLIEVKKIKSGGDLYHLYNSHLYPLTNQIQNIAHEFEWNQCNHDSFRNRLIHNREEFKHILSKNWRIRGLIEEQVSYNMIEFKGGLSFTKEFNNIFTKYSGCPGLYFLYSLSKELIYIGKTKNLGGTRIISSVYSQDCEGYIKLAFTNNDADHHIYEPYFITTLQPKNNSEFKKDMASHPTVTLPEIPSTDFIKIYNEN